MKENVRKWWLDMRWVNFVNRKPVKSNAWNVPIMVGDSEQVVEAAMQWKKEVMRLTNE